MMNYVFTDNPESTSQNRQGDLLKIVSEPMHEKALHLNPGRRYNHLKDIKQSFLHGFDIQKLFSWINEHKKNLVLHRRAR